jgi:hypothetical protein
MQRRNKSVTQIKRVRMENQVRATTDPTMNMVWTQLHGLLLEFSRIPGLPNTTENVK